MELLNLTVFRNWNAAFFMEENSFNICFLSAISQGIILHFLFVFPCNAGGYEDFKLLFSVFKDTTLNISV